MREFSAVDFGLAQALLCEGFPRRTPHFWAAALQRLQHYGGNQQAQYPLGFFMVDGNEPVGIALTPASLRLHADGSAQCVVNISSWYVRERFRWRAGFMLRNIMADKGKVYTDLTPTPELQAVLPKLGMTRINRGVHLHALPLAALRANRSDSAARWRTLQPQERWPGSTPWQGPPRAMVEQHRELGCLPLVLDHAGASHLVIGLRITVRGLPALQLVYTRDRALVLQHLGSLARFLLGQGLWVLVCETTILGHRATALFRPRELWYARGQDFDNRTDVFGSELSIIHAPAAQGLLAPPPAPAVQA